MNISLYRAQSYNIFMNISAIHEKMKISFSFCIALNLH